MQLPPPWSAAFERLVSEARTDPPYLTDQGSWSVELVGSSTPERVIALLPGARSLVGLREREDLTSAVFSCPEERAVVACPDHVQAGLYGSVSVYPDAASLQRRGPRARPPCSR